MIKNYTFKIALALSAIAMLFLTSCEKEDGGDNPTDSPIKEVTLSRKTDYGNDWIYFSLSEGREVEVAEEGHENDLSWDLAFNRYNIRTNSGLSGKGQGGAFDTGAMDMNIVSEVPADAEFMVDEAGMITGSFTGNGITEVESTYNKVLAKAIEFQGPPPTYTPSNHIYIVKTADGKYAKIKVLGFYNDEGVSGFMNFQYYFQADGSTNLKAE